MSFFLLLSTILTKSNWLEQSWCISTLFSLFFAARSTDCNSRRLHQRQSEASRILRQSIGSRLDICDASSAKSDGSIDGNSGSTGLGQSKAKAKIQFGTKFRPGETAQPDINNLIQTVSGCRLESGPVTTAIIGQRQISALLRSQMMFTAVV